MALLNLNSNVTLLQCIDSYIQNKPFMPLTAAQNEYLIEQKIRNLVHNVGLINEAKHLQKQLGPISKALDQLQSDTTTIADACEVWCGLLKEDELSPYMKTVEKCFNQAMTPSHFLSNILHPVYRGKQLKPEHIACA